MRKKNSLITLKDLPIKKPILETIDLCYKIGLISKEELQLGLRFRWLYTVNYGLPRVQAYNCNKIKGFAPSKYQEETFQEIREEYKLLIAFLYKEDREIGKFLINLIIFNYQPKIISEKIIAQLTKKKKILDKLAKKEENFIKKAFELLKFFYDRKKALFFTRGQKSTRITH
jgi:hypothetical protein